MAEFVENSGCQADGTDGRLVIDEPGCGATEPATVSQGLCSTNHVQNKKKLVLHVDLNSTILVSDDVAAQRTVAALEYYLTTVTWGKMGKDGRWKWLSDSPSLLPPCEDAVSYYKQFGRTLGFTTAAGRRFRKFLDEHLELFLWPAGVKADRDLSAKGEDGRLYHWILPSFFQLLKDLVQEQREFAIVFRTFGTDLPRVLRAVNRALVEGAHPLFPDLPDLMLSVNMTPGKIHCNRRGVVLKRGEQRVSTQDGERGLYRFFSSEQGLGGFQDDFGWWVTNTYSIRGGKPLWIDPFDQQAQHIFIDDNIRQDEEDTIVNPRVFLGPGSDETRMASTSELYDVSLIQTDLFRAIADPNYFTQRVHICLENYERNLQQGAG
ncbi:uncharacterized protein si:dkey-32e6.3 [Betta splendens]|uniref:Uncharacterized protein si:dkey-32e6.3 n=1 Tax=Betta splendens TaxID=158456 RepID=A0A6P7N5E8_BETSP|nr:uncharacterized protein si:dkey-32e6.3 [Betta splendens]